jgi:hypothetical protein
MRQPLEYFYFLCYFEKKSSFAAGAYCSTQRRWRLRQGAGTVARSRPCMIHAVLLGVGGLVYEGRCFTGWAGLGWPAEGKEEVHFLRRVVTCPGTNLCNRDSNWARDLHVACVAAVPLNWVASTARLRAAARHPRGRLPQHDRVRHKPVNRPNIFFPLSQSAQPTP